VFKLEKAASQALWPETPGSGEEMDSGGDSSPGGYHDSGAGSSFIKKSYPGENRGMNYSI